MSKRENIFITWHYTTHGIAFLKHILSAYYKFGDNNIYKQKEISQENMNNVFSNNIGDRFIFDKVYYLTASQKAFDKLSLRRIVYLDNIIKKDNFITENKIILDIWKDIVEKRKIKHKDKREFPGIDEELKYVEINYKKHFEKWKRTLWRDMHHYKVNEQILWFGTYSNAKNIYKSGETFINKILDIKDFRNALQISKEIIPFIEELKEKHPNANFIINASLGSNETQVVWQVLSELNILPTNTILIQTYDNKEKSELRFKPFRINKLPNKIVTEISNQTSIYDKAVKSKSRKLAELKMQYYIKSGFAILLLGERGIGKTRLAEKIAENKKIIPVNCASFTNNQIAESILFGHKKGAFTDAKEDKKGAFQEAEGGILFLDEIHHLDKLVQAKLMKALQTNANNEFTIMPVGGSDKEKKLLKLTIILASNRTITELRKSLLPDFYDRVTQLVIELPPLRDSKKDLPDELENIWKQMKFEETYKFNLHVKKDNKLINWIKNLSLYGNYRDLQKIAIYYKTFLDFNDEIKKLLLFKNAFKFTKNEFDTYISVKQNRSEIEFSENKNENEIINIYKAKLANWAINQYGSAANAAMHFKEKGGKITAPTLYNWRKYSN